MSRDTRQSECGICGKLFAHYTGMKCLHFHERFCGKCSARLFPTFRERKWAEQRLIVQWCGKAFAYTKQLGREIQPDEIKEMKKRFDSAEIEAIEVYVQYVMLDPPRLGADCLSVEEMRKEMVQIEGWEKVIPLMKKELREEAREWGEVILPLKEKA